MERRTPARRAWRVPRALAVAGILACGGAEPVAPIRTPTVPGVATNTPKPLRTIIAERQLRIGIGAAVGSYFGRTDAAGVQYDAVLKREFNVVTPENDLKFSRLRPTRGTFSFARPDSMLAYAQANGMRMRGHTLVWGSQIPAWVTSGAWTKAEVAAILDEHITGVVDHYAGKLAAWDVVNEALEDDGTYRTNYWLNQLGRGYVEQAFRTAAAADPSAVLFYNDYNIETAGPKSDSALKMLAELKSRGVPVHGVGLQGHFVVGQTPSRAALVAHMNRFAALGLKVQITELDIRMAVPATPAALQLQAQHYADVVGACLEVPACDMVVLWGFTDLASWIPGFFPGQGDALPFDAAFQPKPAYTALNELLARW